MNFMCDALWLDYLCDDVPFPCGIFWCLKQVRIVGTKDQSVPRTHFTYICGRVCHVELLSLWESTFIKLAAMWSWFICVLSRHRETVMIEGFTCLNCLFNRLLCDDELC